VEILIKYRFKYALRAMLVDLIKGRGTRVKKELMVK
jgi:hypothetical protein